MKGSESRFYWGQATFFTLNFPGPVFTPDECCRWANDSSFQRDVRRLGVALTFGINVRAGFNTTQMHKALPDSRWLASCTLEHIGGGAGRLPLLLDGSYFRLLLFPQADQEDWEIWFTLPLDKDGKDRTQEEADAFLRGTHQEHDLVMTEFLMSYPIPGCEPHTTIEEYHSARGVGIKIHPSGWFPSPDQPAGPEVPPEGGFVPAADAAIKIAVAVWEPIYGAERIAQEKPYHVELNHGIWHVQGSLPANSIGGVAEAYILKENGRVLGVSHGK